MLSEMPRSSLTLTLIRAEMTIFPIISSPSHPAINRDKIHFCTINSWPTELSAEGHVTVQCVLQTYTTWKLIGIRHREEIIFKKMEKVINKLNWMKKAPAAKRQMEISESYIDH